MPPAPLFVFGVAQRTGTHYLASLLTLHPRCVPISVPIKEQASRPEDHLLEQADPLLSYLAALRRKWHTDWALGDDAEQVLLGELVSGMGRFVVRLGTRSHPEADPSYVVTKTPFTANLRMLVEATPDLPVLVIARDGRAVAESGHATWGTSYERLIRVWRTGVDDLAEAQRVDAKQMVKVIRYEDLLEDVRGVMTEVFEHFGLDTQIYDWEAAAAVPVRGSSVIRGESTDFSWAPVIDARGELGARRWERWPARRQARFVHLAGQQMSYLGYDVTPESRASMIDRILDLGWTCARIGRRTRDRARDALDVARGARVAHLQS